MLLCCVSTNHIQYLGRIDQHLREDSKVRFMKQGAYRTNSENTYNGWRKINIVLKFIIESCANAIV